MKNEPPRTLDSLGLTLRQLTETIAQTHRHFSVQASRAVNIALTLRNWMIGYHIEQYERNGVDRANYGDRLMDSLAESLQQQGVSRCDRRELYRYRQLYLIYPQIVESLPPQSGQYLFATQIVESPTPQSATLQSSPLSGKQILESLSFTHLAELILIDDPKKRAFYEAESIRGIWSVRELKRQIASLYYERSTLSTNKEKFATLTQTATAATEPVFPIRDPYVFEFLGLKPVEVMGESHLEDQLLDHLQTFLLELGHGFCFEARQKRILIGETHGFVDLVFYHRILKCHVLVELKLQAFSHESAGQLNTYVTWYARHMMSEGDNPPIGILLCTQKDHALVDYALAGMDNQLFVSRYQLELPSAETLQRFIEQHLKDA